MKGLFQGTFSQQSLHSFFRLHPEQRGGCGEGAGIGGTRGCPTQLAAGPRASLSRILALAFVPKTPPVFLNLARDPCLYTPAPHSGPG